GKARRNAASGFPDFALRHPQRAARQHHSIEPFDPREQRPIAAPANIRHDPGRSSRGFPIVQEPRGQQPRFYERREGQNVHQSTIFLRGYSTMPWALAAFNFGSSWRTTASSIMVFTATQSGSLSVETVGFLSAGNTASTASRSSRRTF